MLKDKIRTQSYKDFIEGNPEIFKDKIVLDVGCGTGILSMFSVIAGCSHVFAIDNSEIIQKAKEIAKENQMDKKITFIKSKAEQIEILNDFVDKADIIISEWMGYCLLFETMLPSVLFVRDRWLSKGGRVYPDIISLHMLGMSAPLYIESRVNFWKNNVYGFKMQSIANLVLVEPDINYMEKYETITDSYIFFEFDCNTVKPEQLDFTSSFTLHSSHEGTMDVFVIYFDVNFSNANKPVSFSTGPRSPETHWRQTVLILNEPLNLKSGDIVTGKIELKSNRESFRDLDIYLTYQLPNFETPKQQKFSLK